MKRRDADKETATRRGCLRRAWRLFQSVVVLALVGGGSYAVYHHLRESPEYQVRRIIVEGNTRLSADEVAAATGIEVGDNVVFTRTDAAAARVEALPLVKHADVARRFPDEVVVRVKERVAVAALLAGNRAFEIDDEAVVVFEASLASPLRHPLISYVPDLGVVEVGEQLDSPALTEALALWRAFQTFDVAAELAISEIAAYDAKDLRMYFDDLAFEVRWGRGNYAEQGRRLDILWRQLGGPPPCAEYLDLRFEPDVICK